MKLEPRGTFQSGEHEPRIEIVGDRLVLALREPFAVPAIAGSFCPGRSSRPSSN